VGTETGLELALGKGEGFMASDTNRSNRGIPAGISFGNKVLKLPHASTVFDRAIWIQACLRNNPRVLFDNYTWVKKGENLIEFTILTPKIGIPFVDFFVEKNYNKIYIPSPVSGLLLYTSYGFGDRNKNYGQTTFLLPDDEPPANGGEFMFSRLCNWDHREYIFYKPSEFSSFNDQNLSEDFAEQKSRSCEYFEAMPEFESHFREARTKHPELRPYLKHLL